MSSKKNILMVLESQIDKIVLGVIILVGLALLWFFVISNPYAVKVQGYGKLSPSAIDGKIKDAGEDLLQGLEKSPESMVFRETYRTDFAKLMECPVADIPSDLVIQFPGVGDTIIEEDRLYDVPVVPSLFDVQIANLRGAAQVPIDEITPGAPYESADTKLDDIDLVTISGRFDIQALYNSFQLSFNGPSLKNTWKEPELAEPVFAKLELQRREKLQDGSWGDWNEVPRTQIDMYRKLLSRLPLSPEEMQFGINIVMSQYKGGTVQMDILQPESYRFGVSRTAWMPPEYLRKADEIIIKEQEQEKRRLREEKQKAADSQRGMDRRPTTTRTEVAGADRTDPRREMLGGGDDETNTLARALRDRQREETVEDVQQQAESEKLAAVADLKRSRDPLLIWAHDDTAEPGKTYQYRIRMGVFNPIMGKDWFANSQAEFKDQIVLWSAHSDPTEPMTINPMLQVFPMETIANASKVVEGVKVEVAKYYQGQWKSHEFDIYPGQVIGQLVTAEEMSNTNDEIDVNLMLDIRANPQQQLQAQEVDFTTDMVMVDLVNELKWDTRKSTSFYQMLYYTSAEMMQVPIGRTNWSKSLRDDYQRIQDEIEQEADLRSADPYDRVLGMATQ